ncbi:DNA-binding transcriptional regulator, ArsR family [Peptoniphilus asaccharolyticus DSM 20463]|uniref:DNA-binding transcriptional regulator, ArsR family n=1 Tax=Peptoniphilus asaccharolyticus DSM 20463 TaxID=573058 RepID=A0A1W1VI57_PEPAS|nr:autorepressor SdpR family transcription factor [Peptoniphilus asaccharolyticus]MBL7574339.1 winged helix-turn-helix transcriptional regulator [Peptoniphilus asaccharolyticus]SMB93065.1 DNA-binding transcriptional regulator, ArsR family [Peptoniphilus asaccharolyticus DSM 20463]
MSLEKTFKALADKNRREILSLLKRKSLTAGEISENFDMTNATLSYHLQILKDAGLIFDEKDKNFRVYSLNASVFEEVLAYFFEFRSDEDEK